MTSTVNAGRARTSGWPMSSARCSPAARSPARRRVAAMEVDHRRSKTRAARRLLRRHRRDRVPAGDARFNVAIRTVVGSETGVPSAASAAASCSSPRPTPSTPSGWSSADSCCARAGRLRADRNPAPRERPYWLRERHLERLAASAAYFGFACDTARIDAALDAEARRHPAAAWRVRLQVDRNGAPRTEAFALEPAAASLRFALADTPV